MANPLKKKSEEPEEEPIHDMVTGPDVELKDLMVSYGAMFEVTGQGPQAVVEEEEAIAEEVEKTPEQILEDMAWEIYFEFGEDNRKFMKMMKLAPTDDQYISPEQFDEYLASFANAILNETDPEIMLNLYNILQEEVNRKRPDMKALHSLLRHDLFDKGLIEDQPKSLQQIEQEALMKYAEEKHDEQIKDQLRYWKKDFKKEKMTPKKVRELDDKELKETHVMLQALEEQKMLTDSQIRLAGHVETEIENREIREETIPPLSFYIEVEEFKIPARPALLEPKEAVEEVEEEEEEEYEVPVTILREARDEEEEEPEFPDMRSYYMHLIESRGLTDPEDIKAAFQEARKKFS